MNHKTKGLVLCSALAIFLASCAPLSPKKEETIADTEEQQEEVVEIPAMQIEDKYYKTLLPFKQSETHGLVVDNLGTKYDMEEVEDGLLRISSQYFPTKDYFFRGGQYLPKDVVISWLSRVDKNEAGLNQASSNTGDDEQNPVILAHITEQNYLKRSADNKVSVEGISIGLALNSVFYNRAGAEIQLSDATLKAEGERLANEVVKRMREELDVTLPIVVGVFKQEERNSIVPGTYFMQGKADKGKNSIGSWTMINEEYVIFPKSNTEEKYRDLNMKMNNFKQDVDKFFPSFVNVIGKGFYVDGDLQKLTIEMPIQFFGTSETVGFTQHVTGLIVQHFSSSNVEVNIHTINGPEALILKKPNEEEPFVHLYRY